MNPNYLDTLKRSAREVLREPRVGEFMSSITIPGKDFPVDFIIGELERHMREYASNWEVVAGKHEKEGLYRKIAEFAGLKGGLYVDLGCGAGNLLCALPGEVNLIGADINPYMLDIAEENIRRSGKKVQSHNQVRMGFLPSEGLVVRPKALIEELDFSRVQLISDDLRDMNNTKRVLYYNGIKADGAFFSLAGGHSVQRAGEIISFLKYRQTGLDHKELKSIDDIVGPVLRKIGDIVKRGGHVYLAVRGVNFNQDLEVQSWSLRDYLQTNHSRNLEIVEETTIQMMSERGETGIGISHYVDGGENVPEEIKEKVAKLPYQLNLSKVRVK